MLVGVDGSSESRAAVVAANRLLASWGHDAREMELVLQTAAHVDHHHPTQLTRDTLLARFRSAGQAILLGTASFWEGVDVPGDALRGLVIA